MIGAFDPIESALFLDFDGVLHPMDSGEVAFEGAEISLTGARLFVFAGLLADALAARPDIPVIAHTSWRNWYSAAELRDIVPAPLGPRITDITFTRMSRFESIEAYISDHQIKHHLILDDAGEQFPERHPSLILCDPARGISDPEVIARVRAWALSLPLPPSASGAPNAQGSQSAASASPAAPR